MGEILKNNGYVVDSSGATVTTINMSSPIPPSVLAFATDGVDLFFTGVFGIFHYDGVTDVQLPPFTGDFVMSIAVDPLIDILFAWVVNSAYTGVHSMPYAGTNTNYLVPQLFVTNERSRGMTVDPLSQ